jgi:hypothetical protein
MTNEDTPQTQLDTYGAVLNSSYGWVFHVMTMEMTTFARRREVATHFLVSTADHVQTLKHRIAWTTIPNVALI